MKNVFVYGTLKEDFANFGVNSGRRIPGIFRTVDQLPLYVIGENRIPWLVNQPGHGQQVIGQVFEVDDIALKSMDRLERVHEQGWYSRGEILVQEVGFMPSHPVKVFVYFGAKERLHTATVHVGPIAEFTQALNSQYRRNAA